MKRLSALDALFLYMETPETPMHVASVTTFQPEAPSDDFYARFRAHTAARLDLLPSYRRRLETTPLGLDHPVWVEDDKLDLDYHIRRAALPKPGGMAELNALVAGLHAVALDRTRPLWEMTFIEGLEGGAFAVYVKVHHCLMDGVAGMATLGVVYDFAPDAEAEKLPPRIIPADEAPVDTIELTSSAIGDFVRQGWRAITGLPSIARALVGAAPNFARDAKFLYSYVKDMPRTPFNVAVSRHRVYATASLPLAEVKALAKARGATVNDVVMALTSGALRRYLAGRGALPEKPLTAAVPVSLRPLDDARLNNQVIFTISRLPTDVGDPLPRLNAAKAAGREAKALFADVRGFITTNASILGAPLAIMGAVRLWSGARAANYVWPFCNLVVSNVPGPRKPMYCVGAPATHYFPVSIPFNGGALNVTVQSYCDTLDFGLIACRDAVPDVERIADFLVEEFAALKGAAAEFLGPDVVERIAVKLAAKPAAAMRPITLGEAAPKPPRLDKRKEPSALSRESDALAEASEALRRAVARRVERPATKRAPRKAAGEATIAPKSARARKSAKNGAARASAVPDVPEETPKTARGGRAHRHAPAGQQVLPAKISRKRRAAKAAAAESREPEANPPPAS